MYRCIVFLTHFKVDMYDIDIDRLNLVEIVLARVVDH